ncbi:unnamed protein product [Bemisia tabaci]|uniref:Uncharacterized protein n=1 Tax=Bemisia tabaci TaxID=7038 RepID=A0A9P0A4H5_BEMTA|nr:unnamed protein product [Bemisia tabaci]
MTAAEILTLVTHLGLLIGDKVSPDDKHWELYLILREIVDIVLAPSYQEKRFDQLDTLVEFHNNLFIELSNEGLKNKFHHLVHYKSHIKKFGPLIHLWVMRLEAKHQPSKAAANVILSRRNISHSLGLKSQLQVMNAIVNGSKNPVTAVSPKGFWTSADEVEILENVTVPNNFPSELLCTDWVKFHGVLYTEETVIIQEIQNDIPLFFKIHSIFLSDKDEVFFVCNAIDVIEFNSHFYAYKVQLTDSFCVIDCHKVQIHSACSILSKLTGDFITLRHKW